MAISSGMYVLKTNVNNIFDADKKSDIRKIGRLISFIHPLLSDFRSHWSNSSFSLTGRILHLSLHSASRLAHGITSSLRQWIHSNMFVLVNQQIGFLTSGAE